MSRDRTPARHRVLSRRGRILAAVTLLLAAGTAWLVASSDPAFRDVVEPVQLMESVFVPFVGVLAVTDLHRPGAPSDARLARRLLTAAGFAVAGLAMAAAATARAGDAWPAASQTGPLLWGAVLVQLKS